MKRQSFKNSGIADKKSNLTEYRGLELTEPTRENINVFDTRIFWKNVQVKPHNFIDIKFLQNVRKVVLSAEEMTTTIESIFGSKKEAESYYNKLLTMPSLKTFRYINNNRYKNQLMFEGEFLFDEFIYEKTGIFGLENNANDDKYSEFFIETHDHVKKIIRNAFSLSHVTFKNMCLTEQIMKPLRGCNLTQLKLINVNLSYHLNDVDMYFPGLESLYLCTYKSEKFNFVPNDDILELSMNCISRLNHGKR